MLLEVVVSNEGGEEIAEHVASPRVALATILVSLVVVVVGGQVMVTNGVVLDDPAALQWSLAYMVAVSVVVLGLFYWRRGIDRRAAVVCILLYVPSFFVV